MIALITAALQGLASIPKLIEIAEKFGREIELKSKIEALEKSNEAARYALQNPSDMVARENAVKALWAATNR